MSGLLSALPTTYRSHPVIPFAPNANADRSHQWDWTGRDDTIASGLTTASVDPAQGTETFTLAYDGLTRSDVRTIEAFVETQAGRKTGFWCPTFQRDFYVNSRGAGYNDSMGVREWGYSTLIYPLGNGYHHFAAHRYASGLSTPWALGRWNGAFSATTADGSGIAAVLYTADAFSGNFAGDNNVWGQAVGGSNPQNTNGGLALMRLLWVRFAEDAITTEWSHPALASLTLRVTSIAGEAPVG